MHNDSTILLYNSAEAPTMDNLVFVIREARCPACRVECWRDMYSLSTVVAHAPLDQPFNPEAYIYLPDLDYREATSMLPDLISKFQAHHSYWYQEADYA